MRASSIDRSNPYTTISNMIKVIISNRSPLPTLVTLYVSDTSTNHSRNVDELVIVGSPSYCVLSRSPDVYLTLFCIKQEERRVC